MSSSFTMSAPIATSAAMKNVDANVPRFKSGEGAPIVGRGAPFGLRDDPWAKHEGRAALPALRLPDGLQLHHAQALEMQSLFAPIQRDLGNALREPQAPDQRLPSGD